MQQQEEEKKNTKSMSLLSCVNMFSPRGGIRIAVIGSAGRGEDAVRMHAKLFENAIERFKSVCSVELRVQMSEVHLISGGAAWIDHIAVRLFNTGQVRSLTLHLPAQWDSEKKCFDPNNGCGSIANLLHKSFSRRTKTNSLEEIEFARRRGANFVVHRSFKHRNTFIAEQARFLVAFTWAQDDAPKRASGAFDTWKKTSCRKIHIPLGTLNDLSQD